MNWVLQLLENIDYEPTPNMLAFTYDMALMEQLELDDPGETKRLAQLVVDHSQVLIDQAPSPAERLASCVRICMAALLADHTASIELPSARIHHDDFADQLLLASCKLAIQLAEDAAADTTPLDELLAQTKTSQEEWLQRYGSRLGNVFYLIGILHTAEGMRALARAHHDQDSKHVDKAQMHFTHVNEIDGHIGPSPLTALPRPALVGAAGATLLSRS